MKKRFLAVTMAAIMALATLAGCGSTPKAGESSGEAPASKQKTVEAW